MRQEVLLQDFEQISALPLPWGKLKGKRIFITGATGFIGGYLAKTLCWLNSRLSLKMDIGLFHRSGTTPPFTDSCVRWFEGAMAESFIPKDFRPDIIIHAASPANQRAIQFDPIGVICCNILATRYLLEQAYINGACIVYFSSGEIYQRRFGQIMEEELRMLAKNNSFSLYGSSKLAGELLCEEYRRRYGVDSRILRLFSVFGPGEPLTSGRCFTDFMRQAFETHSIRVDGPGTQIRSYCYLSDFVSGLLYVLLKGESTVYNVGNEDNSCTILELARQMAGLFGNAEVAGPLSADAQTDSYIPDTTKLRQLGWRPQVDLQTCIKRCLESYRAGVFTKEDPL